MYLASYYDIESLTNVFTLCLYHAKEDSQALDVYVLQDPTEPLYQAIHQSETSLKRFYQKLSELIHEKNPNFQGPVTYYDLNHQESNDRLAKQMGLSDASSVNNPQSRSTFDPSFRPVCDTDPNYDRRKDPYLLGYNSLNYDTTMLAQYFHLVYPIQQGTKARKFKPIRPQEMRTFNDELFSSEFRRNMPSRLLYDYDGTKTHKFKKTGWDDPVVRIRQNFVNSGRHVDVALLNEGQKRMALKRLLAILGYQVLESDKLSGHNTKIETEEELLDLLAYNVSDVVNLEALFKHPVYQNAFDLRYSLLQDYPELIYTQKQPRTGQTLTQGVNLAQTGNNLAPYEPDIHPTKVSFRRLTLNNTSANFATYILCPYGTLVDDEVVSFDYPSKARAEALGIEPFNVLEATKDYFDQHFGHNPEAVAEFKPIYDYYKDIEGKNFNDSKSYSEDFGPAAPEAIDIYSIRRKPNNIFYFDKNGKKTSCFATFSIGGIHGQEANIWLQKAHEEEALGKQAFIERVKAEYPDPLVLRKARKVTLKDGTELSYQEVLRSGITIKKMEEMKAQGASLEDLQDYAYRKENTQASEIFQPRSSGDTKLQGKYAYTSYGEVIHADFKSYYPNLLMNMEAFYNPGLGRDRYSEVYHLKEELDAKRKDPSLTPEERKEVNVKREGPKLILNSASGAANASFDTPIKVSNKIIAMRIIGQLFTWRVGQALTLAGGKVISTNTDGLYIVTDDIPAIENALALASKDIYVEIEPEPMYLISKDSNNRMEIDASKGQLRVTNAAGGSLGNYYDTSPTQSLTQPAVIDFALGEYLIQAAMETPDYPEARMNKPFDMDLGRSILERTLTNWNDPKWLTMYQFLLASSPSSSTFPYGTDTKTGDIVILQQYNRAYLLKDGTENTLHINTATRTKITPASAKRRKKNGERAQIHDPLALDILKANQDIDSPSDIPYTHEARLKKATKIEAEWYMFIENKDLAYLPEEEVQFLRRSIDLDKYLDLLRQAFENNWQNHLPEKGGSHEA